MLLSGRHEVVCLVLAEPSAVFLFSFFGACGYAVVKTTASNPATCQASVFPLSSESVSKELVLLGGLDTL